MREDTYVFSFFAETKLQKNAQSLKYKGGKIWEKYIMEVHNLEYQN